MQLCLQEISALSFRCSHYQSVRKLTSRAASPIVQGVLSVHGSPGWVCKGSVPGAGSPKPSLKQGNVLAPAG